MLFAQMFDQMLNSEFVVEFDLKMLTVFFKFIYHDRDITFKFK